MVQESVRIENIGESAAREKIDRQFETLSAFINIEYEHEMRFIDHKINRYYDLYDKKYDQNGVDPAEIEAVNECIVKCFEKGFVTYEEVYLSNEIPYVFLIDEKIETIEYYLEQHYGYQSKASKQKEVQRIIEAFEGRLR